MKRSIRTIGSRLLPAGALLLVACGSSDSGGGSSVSGGSSSVGGGGSPPGSGTSVGTGGYGNPAQSGGSGGATSYTGGSGATSSLGGTAVGGSAVGGIPGTGGQVGIGGTTGNATGGVTARTGGADAGGSSGRTGTNAGGATGRTGGAANAGGTSSAVGGANAGGATSLGGAAVGGTNAGGATSLGGAAVGGATGVGGTTSLNCATPPTSTAYAVDTTGVTFTIGSGRLRLQVCKEDIMRVEYTSTSTIPAKTSLSVSATWGTTPFCVSEAAGAVTITTTRMKAKVVLSTGVVSYTDLSDAVILAESSKSTTAATVEGTSTFKVATTFSSPSTEALYGMGQHQDSNMNLKGKSVHILNANTQINIPVLVSNKGYGVFWDNYSTSDFASTTTSYSYTSEAGPMVDYYFFYGPSIDQVISLYRTTTGAAPMFPKWAYGLFQSKDHYASQTEVLNVANGYRNANIPVDVVVQDWNYWDPYSWGSHIMDPSRYANPSTMLNTMHTANIHGMISIWPEYQYMASPPTGVSGDQDNYKALDAIGALFPSGGTHHFYDVFNADARTLVYQQIYDKLLGKYGWDAIWADNTEPQAYPDSINMHSVDTVLGKGALYINAYPLQHLKALYEGWRKVGPNTKRVYVLTRSSFAGEQRYSGAVWSGDINSDFATYVKQIPAGLNYALAGMPYWTTDIGGYWGGSVDWSSAANSELFTRWFQFGAFCSQFRIHGQGARELYGTMWNATTKANLLAVDNLHYRLMPYLYSLAAKVTNEGYTIMRHLIFDYPNDTNVFNIKDQFMFGPAILVNPVITAGATSRSVYLPAGTWYDFWTGSTVTGGATATAAAPLSQIPLYVKAGSIVPMGPMIQYAAQSADPLEIRIYPGKDATFTLYEDEGDTYNYETGKFANITFTWNEASQQLTIGARSGSFTGMLASRTFNIVWVAANHGSGIGVTATADQIVKYDGSSVTATAK
jgi:alpha-D-xyloside xylohydrolase